MSVDNTDYGILTEEEEVKLFTREQIIAFEAVLNGGKCLRCNLIASVLPFPDYCKCEIWNFPSDEIIGVAGQRNHDLSLLEDGKT
jgi:hypothetical protein